MIITMFLLSLSRFSHAMPSQAKNTNLMLMNLTKIVSDHSAEKNMKPSILSIKRINLRIE